MFGSIFDWGNNAGWKDALIKKQLMRIEFFWRALRLRQLCRKDSFLTAATM